MLLITTSSKFIKEKKYIISVLLKDFIGLDYKVNINENQQDYIIVYKSKSIVIKDSFFNIIDGNNYLEVSNIPSQIIFTEKNTPIIYGDNSYSESENKIELGLDIFASSFFMLTRWEEYVIDSKDYHKRFNTADSLAYKNNFHRKPIVNEYLELLWECLLKIGVDKSSRLIRNYKIQFSHDLDHPLLFPKFNSFVKQTSYQILRKGNVKQALKFTIHYLSSKKDPYDTFDLLMGISEKNNSISQFNFMNCSKGKFDEGYNLASKFNKRLIQKIKDRGHYIGFHPSYETYNNPKLWKKEKEGLEKLIDQKITKGRQHYLRFDNPVTWQLWHENNMIEDSTLGYQDDVGFRAGTCFSYHPFDIINKQKLDFLETPLILMEGALINSLKVTPLSFVEVSNQLKNEVKKYNGTYTILWHNSSFFLEEYKSFEEIINTL